MDLLRYAAMSRYWESHPPLHLMVQGYLGIEGKHDQPPSSNTSADLEEFMRLFANGGSVN